MKISKFQWESIGKKAGWMKRTAYTHSKTLPLELEKDLKNLAIRYNKGEVSWENVTSQIIKATRDNPDFRQISLDMVVDFVTRLAQAEQQKSQVLASKKEAMMKITAENVLGLDYDDNPEYNVDNDPNTVYDISTDEFEDIKKLPLHGLVELYDNGEFNDVDSAKLEAEMVQRRAEQAEFQMDRKKEGI